MYCQVIWRPLEWTPDNPMGTLVSITLSFHDAL
jgi:hypothetical protein